MTVPPNNDADSSTRHPRAALQQFHSNSTLDDDPVEHENAESKIVRSLPCRQLPSWLKEQFPHWGERIFVPEWDYDEEVEGEGGGDGCGGDCYRSNNGWKVRI